MESRFGIIEGVIRTRVGYAGGVEPHPDYHHIKDHTETVQIDYDPRRITFSRLLDVFWQSHNPASQPWSRQYLHAVFYHDDRQQELARASLSAVEEKSGIKVQTKILPVRRFTLAEDYHQKYLLKQQPTLTKELRQIYPNSRQFIDSTAVSRLNGYSGGNGNEVQLRREIDRLGLSEAGKRGLRDMVRRKAEYDR